MSHTATGEWKSFEIRMRRRRAERCMARADIDLARGAFDEARLALQEARRLAPDLPELADLEDSIRRAETAARLTHDSRRRQAFLYGALAVVLLAAAGGAVWMAPMASSIHSWAGQSPSVQSPSLPELGAPTAQPRPAPAALAEHPTARVVVDQEPITVTEDSAHPPAPVEMEAGATTGHATEPPPSTSSPDARDTRRPDATTLPNIATLPVEKIVNPPEPTLARLDADIAPIPAPPVGSPAAANPGPVASFPGHTAMAANAAEPAVANATVSTPPAAPHDDVLVQQTLDRYATAYTRLDADAAQQVWPSVDRKELARAFGGLALQRVSLGDCQIDVQGAAASAACAGTETWAPKIGAHGPHTAARNWTFQLMKAGTGWQIVSARVQNK